MERDLYQLLHQKNNGKVMLHEIREKEKETMAKLKLQQ